MQENQITQSRLKELFDYNHETGELIRTTTPMHLFKKGTIAGRRPNEKRRYLDITIDGKQYVLHRVIWLYVYGEWPEKDIDHINRKRFDNRIENLRLADRYQNMQNLSIQPNNTTGFKGVTKFGDKWRARISVNKIRFSLGLFDSAERASAAYVCASKLYQSHSPDDGAFVFQRGLDSSPNPCAIPR